MKNLMHKLILLCGLCACAWTLSAQDGTIIQGTVTDASGEPIIGATIMASPQNGTTTDFDGRFTLKVNGETSFTVSYVGFVNYEQTIQPGRDTYRIVLREDTEQLDELVVVGYGTQKRSDLTGSISSVSADEIRDFSSRSLADRMMTSLVMRYISGVMTLRSM